MLNATHIYLEDFVMILMTSLETFETCLLFTEHFGSTLIHLLWETSIVVVQPAMGEGEGKVALGVRS